MNWLVVSALLGGLGVALGAFGAHGLKKIVDPDLLQVWETGVRYHLFHTLALFGIGLLRRQIEGTALTVGGWLFVAGITIFSGTLYLMTVTGARWLGAITPIGGLSLIAGWVALAIGVWKR